MNELISIYSFIPWQWYDFRKFPIPYDFLLYPNSFVVSKSYLEPFFSEEHQRNIAAIRLNRGEIKLLD